VCFLSRASQLSESMQRKNVRPGHCTTNLAGGRANQQLKDVATPTCLDLHCVASRARVSPRDMARRRTKRRTAPPANRTSLRPRSLCARSAAGPARHRHPAGADNKMRARENRPREHTRATNTSHNAAEIRRKVDAQGRMTVPSQTPPHARAADELSRRASLCSCTARASRCRSSKSKRSASRASPRRQNPSLLCSGTRPRSPCCRPAGT